jgi:exosome complex component RRP43
VTGPERHPLPLGSLPLSCSFGIFQSSVSIIIQSLSIEGRILTNRTYFLPDPTALETPLLPTTLVIALDEKNKACLVRHEGKGGMKRQTGEAVIDQAWGAAEERIKEIRGILDESTA